LHFLLQACAFRVVSFSNEYNVRTNPDTGILAHFRKHMRSTDVGSFIPTWRFENLL